MDAPNPIPEEEAHELCAWFGYWVQFAVLAFCVVLGAFFGGRGDQPGDQTAGVILVVAASLIAFMRLKAGFDGEPGGLIGFLFVDNMASLVPAIIVLTIVGIAGLFVAASHESGGLHNGGVALVLVAALFVLLNIKRVFDAAETHR